MDIEEVNSYYDNDYWYMRKPYWLWGRAARVVCALVGCKVNRWREYGEAEWSVGDCYRCG